jgi:acetyl esterase
MKWATVIAAIAVAICYHYSGSNLCFRSYILAKFSKLLVWDVRPLRNPESLKFWRGQLEHACNLLGSQSYGYKRVALDADVSIGIFNPSKDDSSLSPVLLWFHGGGFVEGSVHADRKNCFTLSQLSGYLVVSVDYRLAPEHPFPAAVNDSSKALHWVLSNIEQYGGDPTAVVIGGESAGGNLAAASVIALVTERGQRAPELIGAVLIYPCLDHGVYTDSHFQYRNTNGLLPLAQMQWYWNLYFGSDQAVCGRDIRACPARAPPQILELFPPTSVVLAGVDVLFDEGMSFGNKLKNEGVDVKIAVYADVIHAFFGRPLFGHSGDVALNEVAVDLREFVRRAKK